MKHEWSEQYKAHNGIGQQGTEPHPTHDVNVSDARGNVVKVSPPGSGHGCQCEGDETYPGGCRGERNAKAEAEAVASAPPKATATAPPPASSIES